MEYKKESNQTTAERNENRNPITIHIIQSQRGISNKTVILDLYLPCP